MKALGAVSVELGLGSLISDLVVGAGKLVCGLKNAGQSWWDGFVGGFESWGSSFSHLIP
jgi:hypothetical protein